MEAFADFAASSPPRSPSILLVTLFLVYASLTLVQNIALHTQNHLNVVSRFSDYDKVLSVRLRAIVAGVATGAGSQLTRRRRRTDGRRRRRIRAREEERDGAHSSSPSPRKREREERGDKEGDSPESYRSLKQKRVKDPAVASCSLKGN